MIKIFLITFFFAINAFAAVLITGQRAPGFEPPDDGDLYYETVTIHSNGVMNLKLKSIQTGKIRFERMGTLSPYALKRIKDDIRNIRLSTPFKDLDPDGPECTDTPAFKVSVHIRGTKKPIYKEENCHEWRLNTFEGYRTIAFTKGLLEL